jgi:7-keto-8-aminopelargonate synthetase-like enzyme
MLSSYSKKLTLKNLKYSRQCNVGLKTSVGVWSEKISEIKAANTFKEERVITSPMEASITVSSKSTPVLNFCANNYLGMSNNPDLIEAADKALHSHGLGLSSVRFICGTQDIHKELEKKISEFHGTEDTILYGSCFDANGGIFEALLEPELDAVFSDSLNHASIIDGMRLCKAQKFKYNHLDTKHLEELLQTTKARIKFIVTDGAFSMDGDIAPLDTICALAEKYGAIVMIDECHATGFIGKTGRGTPELFGVDKKVHLINSTLGKALGGATGGYTTGKT